MTGQPTRNGLPVDPAKDRDWRRRSAQKYAAKQRQRRHEARLATKVKPAKPGNDWPARTRKLAKQRSGGWCEIGGNCRATDLHHRKARRHRDHRVENALHLCRRHHDLLGTAGVRATALVYGWIVPSGRDPARTPVLLASGERAMLTADGRYEDAA